MAGFFKNLFDSNAKEIKKYTQLVGQINALEPQRSEEHTSELQSQR